MKETACFTIRPLANTATRSPAIPLGWRLQEYIGKFQSVCYLQGPLPQAKFVILPPSLLHAATIYIPKACTGACFAPAQKLWMTPHCLGNKTKTPLALNAPKCILHITVLYPSSPI